MITLPLERQVDALDEGHAYVDLDDVALTLVAGADARAWLNDLVTTDVGTLGRFETRPSLLLTPTGRIRASFHVLGFGERDFVLAQRDGQPAGIADLLAPYVLSSEVTLTFSPLRILAIPGREDAPAWFPDVWRPSVLGGGIDLLVDASQARALDDVHDRLREEGLEPAGREAVEARRILRSEARFPRDVDADSLPAEAGLDAAPATDRSKGCFLGQEAVAKVANLGHPTRVVVAVEADEPVPAGEPVLADGRQVGSVTSSVGRAALVRVRWDARDAVLATATGTQIRPR
jgi:folate-binding protein YgfZ